MRATKQYVEEKFAQYNNLCFGGKLPTVRVSISRAKCFVGQLKYKIRHPFLRSKEYFDFRLLINSRYDYPQDVIDDTIIHEMIHLYILYNNIKDTAPHGEVFRKIMKAINEKYNRNIAITHKNTDAETNSDCKKRYNIICLSFMRDGSWCVTVCTTSKIFEIYRAFKESSLIREMRWYHTTDVFFNKYPASRTPKLYRISEEDMNNHITNARQLEIDGHKVVYKK